MSYWKPHASILMECFKLWWDGTRGLQDNIFFQILANHNDERDNEEAFVYAVISQWKDMIAEGKLDLEKLAQDAIAFAQKRDRVRRNATNRLLFLELVDFFVLHQVENRELCRNLLTELFYYSSGIDRELFLDDVSTLSRPSTITSGDRGSHFQRKQDYVLRNVAGMRLPVRSWSLPRRHLGPGDQDMTPYLDLHLRGDVTWNPMIDAVYTGKVELILKLLRHGAYPSCTYLWILLCFMAVKVRHNEDCEWEMEILGFFCRARRRFALYVSGRGEHAIEPTPEGDPDPQDYHEILVAPSEVLPRVPEDRYRSPPSLMHLCRCRIREKLQENDWIPTGILRLGLPRLLRDYVDLLID